MGDVEYYQTEAVAGDDGLSAYLGRMGDGGGHRGLWINGVHVGGEVSAGVRRAGPDSSGGNRADVDCARVGRCVNQAAGFKTARIESANRRDLPSPDSRFSVNPRFSHRLQTADEQNCADRSRVTAASRPLRRNPRFSVNPRFFRLPFAEFRLKLLSALHAGQPNPPAGRRFRRIGGAAYKGIMLTHRPA